jgi:acyl carrier protein
VNPPVNGTPADRERILDGLWKWFKGRGAAMEKFQPNETLHYLEMGLIDSMGLMELIAELEQTYGIRFDESHFQDPRFTTLQGLAELTAGLCGKKVEDKNVQRIKK